jgi:hypothetical protein
MFIHKNIVYRNNVRTTIILVGIIAESELFWVSLGGWYVGGTNEKEFTCALCGSSLRAAAGSFDDDMAD